MHGVVSTYIYILIVHATVSRQRIKYKLDFVILFICSVMGKKVKLAFILRDASRRATYNKRKNGILKKVMELSILCGVPACAIIYGERGSRRDIWPPSPISVRRVVSRFLEMPEMKQSMKMVDQEAFLRDRIFRIDEQLRKLRKDNREKGMTCIMLRALEGLVDPTWLDGLTMLDLTDLGWVIDLALNQVNQTQGKLSTVAGFEGRTEVATDEAASLFGGTHLNLEEARLSPT